jgi:hypothetical protein
MPADMNSEDIHASASDSDIETEQKKSPAPRKRGRKLRWLMALALLGALVWFLPNIIAHTPLLGWILNTAAADLNGNVSVQSASLAWLSPIMVQGVEVNGKDGKNIIALRSAHSERTLASILWNYTDVGMFHLQSPRVSIVLHPDGSSNVDDLLVKYMAKSEHPKKKTSSVSFGFGADIADAAIVVSDPSTGEIWQVERVGVRVEMPKNAAALLKMQVSDVSAAGALVEIDKAKKKSPAWRLAARLGCEVQWQTEGDAIQYEAAVDLSGLTMTEADGTRFQEPGIRGYDSKSQSLEIAKMTLASSFVAAGAAGRIVPVGDRNEAQLEGQIRYDLQRLTGLLRTKLGPDVRFFGQGESMVSYRGPLSPSEGQAAASFQWSRAEIGGVAFGAGRFNAAMANGVIQTSPFQLAAGQGRWRLTPWISFAKNRTQPGPDAGPVFGLSPGPLAERIPLDPALCSSILKYVAPALADAKTARGTFSIDLTECRIPLKKPLQSSVSGRLIIHSAEFGSSPMIQELARVLGRESSTRLRENTVIAFHIDKGRIYHEGLELQFPELTIRIRGSVGFDQTMNLTAEMQVPPKWLAGATLVSAALRNQTIQLPMNGSLHRPQFDRVVFEQASRRFVQKAAGNVIENEVNRQVDRLLPPRR